MSDFWQAAGEWAGHTALAGGAVLALGLGLTKLTTVPALRQKVAAWSVRAAVLAAVLCLFPAWLTIPVPVAAVPTVSRDVLPIAVETPVAIVDTEPIRADVEIQVARGPNNESVDTIPEEPDWWEDSAPITAPAPTPPAIEQLSPTVAVEPQAVHVAPALGLSDIAPLLLIPYALGVAALLLQQVAGYIGLVRLRRGSRTAPARVRDAFTELTTGSARPPEVLVSERIESPVCFGFFRPAIVLPVGLAKAATYFQLRWILAHELDHLRRGDPLTGWWVGIARAMYFFLPWFWLLRKELNLAQEYLADAAAAEADGRAIDYAAFLVDLSGGKARLPLAAYAVRAGRSDLFRRVTMLLSSRAGTARPTSRWWAAVAGGSVLSAAVILSGIGWAADDEKPASKTTERKVERIEKGEPQAKTRERRAEDPAPAERRVPGDEPQPRRTAPRDDEPRGPAPAVAEIKKAIADAAKRGETDEVIRLVDRLERTLRSAPMGRGVEPRQPLPPLPPEPPRPGTRGVREPELIRPQPPQPPQVPPPPAQPRRPQPEAGPPPFPPGVDPQLVERMREELDRAAKQFDQAIDKLKDNPEAREALQRAKEEYKRAMEKANQAMREGLRNMPNFPDGGRGFGVGGGGPNNPFRGGGREMTVERQPRFGAVVSPVTEEIAEQFELPKGRGVIVREVVKDTPAEKAGLKKNDVIVQFGGKDVGGDAARFAENVALAKPGEKLEVIIIRKGKKETLKGIELPESPKRDRIEIRPGGTEVRGRDGLQFRFPAEGGPRMNFEKMSVSISNDNFEIDASKGDVKYHLSGTVKDGRMSPSDITITEGRKKSEYKTLNDVPDEHKPAVRQLLSSGGGGGGAR